ncbi:MAG: T9SS type A sorting domain-containing protein, partial [Bacteroidales bacterium]|nr:T9SS type A sorting domain-containing protein [Bacteroidales bacterium]
VVDWKDEYSYDATGNLTEILSYYWNESTSQWVVGWKEECSYDAAGNLTESLAYDWEESTSLWVVDWKDEYSYDATGNLTEILSYYWNESTSQWVACWKDEYSYDAAGNLTEYLSYDWNESISQWVVDWKQEYTYNNSYSFDELLLPYYDDFFILHFRHMLTESISYYWDDFVNQWILDYKGTFFYSEKNINNISDLSVMDIKIYPNPATEFVVFDVNSTSKTAIVEIFDINGKKVLHQELSDNKQISVSHLNRGLYMYKLIHNSTIYSGKIMIE